MPVFKIGEMFEASGFIVVTTNSFLTSKVELVMGKGAAYQLKLEVPGIDKTFGKMIQEKCGHLGRYGLIFNERYGAAQVKYRFNHKAELSLIRLSMAMLANMASKDRNSMYNVNYPGIGNGRLKKGDVYHLLEMLPQNVHVWEKEGGKVYGIHSRAQSEIVMYPQTNCVGLRCAND